MLGASEWIPFLKDSFGTAIATGKYIMTAWTAAPTIADFTNTISFKSDRNVVLANISEKGFSTLSSNYNIGGAIICNNGTITTFYGTKSVSIPNNAVFVLINGTYSNNTTFTLTFN